MNHAGGSAVCETQTATDPRLGRLALALALALDERAPDELEPDELDGRGLRRIEPEHGCGDWVLILDCGSGVRVFVWLELWGASGGASTAGAEQAGVEAVRGAS